MKLVTLLCGFLLITTGTWAYSGQQTVGREKENHETAEMLCNVLVEASTELIRDGSVKAESLKDYLRQDCTKLPSQNNLIQQCQIAVDVYLSDILLHIQSGTERTKICSIIQGHDTSKVVVLKPKPAAVSSNATCVLCEFFVHILQTFATANKSAQELTKILEQVCKEMPKVLQDECKMFVDTYGADIIALIAREFDPTKTCQLIKVCTKSTNVAFLTKANPKTCGLCDYVSTYLAANRPIEHVCNYFSTDDNIRQQCEILVHLYKPDFCQQLPLCFDDVVIQPVEEAIASKLESVECSLCKYIVGYIDTIIQNNKTEAAIEAALEKVCTIVPKTIKDKCIHFVDTYGAILVQLIEKYSSADKVCEALHMCKKETEQTTVQRVERSLKEEPIKSVQCSMCKYIVGYAEKVLGNNRSSAAVEAALDKACNVLPTPVRAECTSFAHKFAPLIAILLAKNASAEEVCDTIKVCHNGTQQLNNVVEQVLNINEPSLKSVQCSICKYIVGYAEKVLGTNRSSAAVEAALDKACNILPSAVRAECTSFAHKFAPLIAILLAKNASAEQVCDTIKVCSSGTQQINDAIEQALNINDLTVNSIECSLCKYIVGYVDTIIQNNKTEAAIEAALEKVCTILPSALKTKCDEFVKTYGPVLVQLIEKYATPEQVCNAMKMCHNGTLNLVPVQRVARSLKEEPIKSVQCSMCKYIVGYAEKVLGNNRSSAAVEAALDKACNVLPTPVRSECTSFAHKFAPLIAILLAKNASAEEVCDTIKVCHNGTQQLNSVIEKVLKSNELSLKSVQCSMCKYIVGYAEKVLGNNRSSAAVEAALDKACNVLPTPVRSECTSFAHKFAPLIAILLAKNASAEEVCDTIKVCHNGTQQLNNAIEQAVNINDLTVNSVECSLCKYIVGYVDTIIQNNKSEAAIEAALEKVCTILPSALKTKCVHFVDTYGPLLVQLIEKYTTPEQVCNAMKMCHNGTLNLVPVQRVERSLKEEPIKSVQCSMCKYIVGYAEKVLGNNRSSAAVEAALDKACNVLPTPVRSECTSFAHKFAPLIAILLAKNASAEEVCDTIKVCHNGTQQLNNVVEQVLNINEPSLKSVQCSICKYIVGYAEKVLGTNRSSAAVEAALDKACNILPSAVRAECTSFAHKFAPLIAILLAKNASAEEVCDTIKVCSSGTQQLNDVVEQIFKTNELTVNSVECSLCKYVVGYVDTIIQNNKSEAAIEAALEKVCGILPSALKPKCVHFVDTYGPLLVQLIEKYTTPEQVCNALQLCHNGTEIVKPKPIVNIVKPIKNLKGDAECALCKYIISYVDLLLQSNLTQQEIKKALEGVCKILPVKDHDKCKNFVDAYGPILAELIAELNDPNVVCEWLSMCPKSGNKFIEIPAIKSKKLKSLPCNLCQYLVNYLDAIIASNSTETKFEDALDHACKILPTTKIQSECKVLVHLYGADMIKLIVEFGNPKKVCETIGICDK